MKTNEPRRPLLHWLLTSLLVATAAGCEQWIYRASPLVDDSADVALPVGPDLARYEWPMTAEQYIVVKPPALSYVTSLGRTMTRPDPVTAELVPWSNDGLDPTMVRFLERGFIPPPTEPTALVTLTPTQFTGPQAFDVSADGTRMVAITPDGLALYRTDDGSLVGHLKLPAEAAAAAPPIDAVRFAGSSKDLLIASPQTIMRISSKNGQVIDRSKSCGEPIAQWEISPDDTAMLIRSESGRLFGGDPQLQFFSAYNLGKQVTCDLAALSHDGRRFAALIDGQTRTYVQEGFQIVSQQDLQELAMETPTAIGLGIISDFYTDGDQATFMARNPDGSTHNGSYRMFWQPAAVSSVSLGPQHNSYLCVGRRWVDGDSETVMFDFGPSSRNHSLPLRLREQPQRYAHSRTGDAVAMLDSQGLHLFRRQPWLFPGTDGLNAEVYDWVNRKKFAELEQLLTIVRQQQRMGYGRTAEELCSAILYAVAVRWNYEQNESPDSDLDAALQQWVDQGSAVALTMAGIVHYERGWQPRRAAEQSGDWITDQIWDTFRKELQLALPLFDRALAASDPPMTAYEHRIEGGLEMGEELEDANAMCKLACERFPCETIPHSIMVRKLLPQWHGQAGESCSFALAASKMCQPDEGALLYARLFAIYSRFLNHNRINWGAYDSERLAQGIDEFARRGIQRPFDAWMMWERSLQTTRDVSAAERAMRYIVASQAAPPAYMSQGTHLASVPQQMAMWADIRNGK